MKNCIKYLVLFFLVTSVIDLNAQAPQSINYQAVARDLSGNPLVSTAVNVEFDILQGSSSGTVVYSETHNTTTNQFGLFTAMIGAGVADTGTFAGIAWGGGLYYLQVEVNGDLMPATQLISVPYALHANTSSNGPPGANGHANLADSITEPSGSNCANGGYLIHMGADDNDDGTLQPLERDISYYICNGLDGSANNNDTSATNELQTLSISNDTIFLTNGGFVILPVGSGSGISLIDADGDTEINVEAAPDQDVIHFSLGNTTGYTAAEYFTMIGPRLEVINSGESVFIGEGAGTNDNLATNQNVFIGKNSGFTNTTGKYNSAIGQNSFQFNTSGNGNIAFGLNSLRDNVTGATNVALGNGALRDHVSGDKNTAIGFVAIDFNSFGFNNTAIGAHTGYSNFSGSGNVFIGYEAGYYETGSNKLYIDNSDTTASLIYGDFANDSLHINGVLKVNDGTQGLNKVLTSDASGNASWQLPVSGADNWGSQVVISSGANISGDGTAGNPLVVTDAVDDADNDPNNERITTFALNGTNDSLIIVEAGVGHAFPLSNLNDGDWLSSAGVIYNTSDLVGIGTSSPNEKLHIADGDPDVIIQDINNLNSTMTGTIAFKDQVGASVLDFGMKANGPTMTSHVSGEHISFQNNFGSGVGTRLFISGSNGNIGVGTVSPSTKLVVAGGNMILRDQSDVVDAVELASGTGAGASGSIGIRNSGVNTVFLTGTGSSWFNAGNLGVGTNAPLERFHVFEQTNLDVLFESNTGLMDLTLDASVNRADIIFKRNGVLEGSMGYNLTNDYLFLNDGVESLVSRNGNIGIGTTTPSADLDVVGNLQYVDGNEAAGFVLTSDASGNATWQAPPKIISFSANTSSTGIPNGSPTNIVFTNIEYNNTGGYNAATGLFTAPETGIYHFDAIVTFDPSTAFDLQMQIRVNGGTYRTAFTRTDPAGSMVQAQISSDALLNVGDVVAINIYQLSGGAIAPVSAAPSARVFFNGHIIR